MSNHETPGWTYWGDPFRIAHHPQTWPFARDGFDLLSAFFHKSVTTPLPHSLVPKFMKMMHNAQQLGMSTRIVREQAQNEQGGSAERVAELGIDPRWKVESLPPHELQEVPEQQGHTGDFEWLGVETMSTPKWLWDSHESRTVRATKAELDEGYIAISYTWGRWRNGEQLQDGTTWHLPLMRANVYPDMIINLKNIMQQLPVSRYFWVDVLCIDQDDVDEKKNEISKQAQIFGGAKAVAVYLWTLDSDELAYVANSLGDMLLQALQFSDYDQQIRSELVGHTKLPDVIQTKLDGKLRLDPWFTSLWALQEMVLAPNQFWLTKSGQFCKVNGVVVNTRMWTRAIQLLEWACGYRQKLWGEAMAQYPRLTSGDVQLKFMAYLVDDGQAAQQRYDDWKQSATDEEREAMESRVHDVQSVPASHALNTAKQLPVEFEPREKEELLLTSHASRWVDWAFGQVCLNLSISSTRQAIIAAGANRQTTKRRADAVLAALKISMLPPEEEGFSHAPTPGGYPYALQQTLLETQDSSYFYVHHGLRMTWDNRPPQSPLYSGHLGVVPPPDGFTQFPDDFLGNLHPLTSMLPSTAASAALEHLDFAKDYIGYGMRGWHLHADGSLHIPHLALRHQMRSYTPGLVWIRPNGLPREILCISPLANHAIRTLDIVVPLLGHGSRVIFLPLLFRRIPREMSEEAWNVFSRDDNNPLAVGIILVGKPSNRRHHSMSYWHKVGTYACNHNDISQLGWQHGILVGSKAGESSVSLRKEDCPQFQYDPEGLGHSVSRLRDPLPVRVRYILEYAWAYVVLRYWSFRYGFQMVHLWGRNSTGPIVRDDSI